MHFKRNKINPQSRILTKESNISTNVGLVNETDDKKIESDIKKIDINKNNSKEESIFQKYIINSADYHEDTMDFILNGIKLEKMENNSIAKFYRIQIFFKYIIII